RSAARAALDLIGAECVEPDTWRRSISQAQNVLRRTPAALDLTGAECLNADTRRRSISQALNVSSRTPGGARSRLEPDTRRRSISSQAGHL
ncbi:hypothetical protein ACF8FG_11090, partial [Pseudomonas sp. YQ_6]|uniref:hypothetical protein n=1 Tax=Pseudomonas sp. YQ_6 TaxID=3367230 RepID=UPI00370C0685